MVGRQRKARSGFVRNELPDRGHRPRGTPSRDPQTSDEVPHRDSGRWGILMATANDMRELGTEDLILRLRESKEELFNLRFQMATGQMDNNRRLRTVRHDIARIYTVMRERELGLSTGPDELANEGGAA